MSKLLAPLAATAILLAFQARADETPMGDSSDPAAMFAQLDSNKDGQLSSDEIPEDRKRLFERLLRTADKNGDGKLNAEEFSAGLKPRESSGTPGATEERRGQGRAFARQMFENLDANHDGKLTLDEVPEPRKDRFRQLIARGDKNGDGALDEQEFLQGFAAQGQAEGAQRGKRPEGRPDPKRLFSRFDKNGDGKLTADEVPEERREFVERLIRRGDKNGDKALSLEEFLAIRPDGAAQDRPANRPERPPGASDRGRRLPGLFGALDTDQDGKLSSGEIAAAAEAIRKLDKNGDGVVTLEEVMAASPSRPNDN